MTTSSAAHGRTELRIVAVNDLTSPENLAYLLKYDTVYGRALFPVTCDDKALVVDGTAIPVCAERDPASVVVPREIPLTVTGMRPPPRQYESGCGTA